jgi:hypothetical protein
MRTLHVDDTAEGAGRPLPVAADLQRGLLGEILIREGLITEAQLEAALELQREVDQDTPLGQLLVRSGAITQRQLNTVLDRYRKKYRLGDILVETEAITEQHLQVALDHQKKTGLRLGETLLLLNFITEEVLNQALCKQFGVTFVDLDRLVLDSSLAVVIDKDYAERHRIIPISKTDRVLVLAMDDPSDLKVMAEVQARTGCRVNVVTSTHAAFQRAFARTYGETPGMGIARQFEALTRAHEALRQEHEAARAALAELRRAHDVLAGEREAGTRALAEQRTRNEWNSQALQELRRAHEALRQEHEAARDGLGRLRADEAARVAELERACEALRAEREADGRRLAAQEERNAWNTAALEELRLAQARLRAESEAARAAGEAREAERDEVARTLARVREERDALLGEREHMVRELEVALGRLKA